MDGINRQAFRTKGGTYLVYDAIYNLDVLVRMIADQYGEEVAAKVNSTAARVRFGETTITRGSEIVRALKEAGVDVPNKG